jgi:hypothetical protein
MADIPFTPPSHRAPGFHCPYSNCRAYADQDWGLVNGLFQRVGSYQVKGLELARCAHCTKESIWLDGGMVFPLTSNAPPANRDLPPDTLVDYQEASAILAYSPRGSAALLRLAIQKLCQHLGEPGKNLNTDIGSLVKKGLPTGVQQALDAVRVIGNNAVHPGQIDLSDDVGTATALFGLVNFISEKMISEPDEIKRLYGLLPAGALAQIQKRDGTP